MRILEGYFWAENEVTNVAIEVTSLNSTLFEFIRSVNGRNMLLKSRAVSPRLERTVIGRLDSLD